NRVNTSTAYFGSIGGKYNAAMTDNDVHELMKFYRSYGFHDVKVARELKFGHDGREVEVTFHVIEGVQYRVADAPKVVGVKSLPAEALEAMNRVKPGDTYKQAEIDGDMARIKDY